jgi:hypothetical protein
MEREGQPGGDGDGRPAGGRRAPSTWITAPRRRCPAIIASTMSRTDIVSIRLATLVTLISAY